MIRKQNRMRVKKPKLRSYWCVCGRRNLTGKKKFKKDVDINQEDML